MAGPILDLGNASHFQEMYEVTIAANSVVSGFHTPIGNHQIPVTFDRHTLLVGASSSTAKPNWFSAFSLSMMLGTSIGTAFSDRRNISFGLTLIRFPVLSAQFRLRAYIFRWHQTMDMKIWQYIGPELDLQNSIEQLETQLVQIEGKIDAL